ncbi:uncharacterized protein A1O9_01721 [Exophiala aquamarina CBS 119918]|uniref:Uncharacterized protein n=1 Tax=Exophiala aquamarina CBS 119918 TaxID=1182545 RepID=A0A072PWL0_9EURO|nr:uncharacterized protein A1O9_01721 [Exophiala aquamarina CBS 119918]KEF63743.1 hypothetical protein A1O9_01721 [Exophiala aquamarina CBS 119918]
MGLARMMVQYQDADSGFLATFISSIHHFPDLFHLYTFITMADDATKAKLRAKFDKLTPADFQAAAGSKDVLADKVAAAYGISKDEASKQVEEVFSS